MKQDPLGFSGQVQMDRKQLMKNKENTFPCQPFKKSENSCCLLHEETLIQDLRQKPERKEMSDSILDRQRTINM